MYSEKNTQIREEIGKRLHMLESGSNTGNPIIDVQSLSSPVG